MTGKDKYHPRIARQTRSLPIRVIAPDWRGFGRSSHRSPAYWFPDYLADLHALLEIYSPDEPVRLIGHSMGGNVCSLYAGVVPERVSAIVNIEGFGLTDSDPVDAPARYRDWLEAGQSSPSFSDYPDFENLAGRIRKRTPGLSAAQADFVAREWATDHDGVDVLPFPSSHSSVIPGVGHMVHFEAPELLAEQIEAFLQKYL